MQDIEIENSNSKLRLRTNEGAVPSRKEALPAVEHRLKFENIETKKGRYQVLEAKLLICNRIIKQSMFSIKFILKFKLSSVSWIRKIRLKELKSEGYRRKTC